MMKTKKLILTAIAIVLAVMTQAARQPKVDHLAEGDRCYEAYLFAEAKAHYEAYLEAAKANDPRLAEVEQLLQRTEVALRYLNRVEDVCVVDSVSFPKEQLMQYLPKMSADMGQLTMEGQTYICTNQRGDRRYTAVRSADGLTTTLCKQERLLDGWSEPDTLPEIINQNMHQAYPLLMPDGLTLYYAAYSDEGPGLWDIYMTKYNPATDSYLKPEPLGMPYNSIGNDYFFVLDESANRGWFASDRNAKPGMLTLYTFIPGEKRLLRDSSETFVRDFARLLVLRERPKEVKSVGTTIQQDKSEQQVMMHMVVGDKVYTTLTDFRHEDARLKAEEYLDLLEQIDEEEQELHRLRAAYHQAGEQERQQMAPVILSLEKDVPRLKRDSAALLTELRRLEIAD